VVVVMKLRDLVAAHLARVECRLPRKPELTLEFISGHIQLMWLEDGGLL
jgi:hypothetical protein